jgi:hypothetical protein
MSLKDSAHINTAKVLYTMLRTHDLVDESVQAEIKNHPIISSEYVKFLATHSGRADILKFRTELADVKSIAVSAQTSATRALKQKS